MFNLKEINKLLNCAICSQLLCNPISLPCGKTVCKEHSEEVFEEKCRFCEIIHTLPEGGFQINSLINGLLSNQLSTLDIKFSKFNDSKKLIEDLNNRFSKIVSVHNDPSKYISEYFKHLRKQVYDRNDKIIQKTELYSNELIKKIDILYQECKAEAPSKTKTTSRVDECKDKLKELNEMFASCEVNDANLEELMSQTKIKALREKMLPLEDEYRRELLGDKAYTLLGVSNEIGIENVFGSLASTKVILIIFV